MLQGDRVGCICVEPLCAVITRLSGRAVTAATKFNVTFLCICADPEQPSTYGFLSYFVVVACCCQTVQAYTKLDIDLFLCTLLGVTHQHRAVARSGHRLPVRDHEDHASYIRIAVAGHDFKAVGRHGNMCVHVLSSCV